MVILTKITKLLTKSPLVAILINIRFQFKACNNQLNLFGYLRMISNDLDEN